VNTKQAFFSGLFDGTSDQIQFESGASFLNNVEKLVQIDGVPEAPRAIDSEAASDADLDASQDLRVTAKQEEAALADEVPGRPPDVGRTATSFAPRGSPAALFQSLTVDRTPDGGLRIEAPPGTAEQLAELLSGMARLLEAAVESSEHTGDGAE
jgi:hypothetical protein